MIQTTVKSESTHSEDTSEVDLKRKSVGRRFIEKLKAKTLGRRKAWNMLP